MKEVHEVLRLQPSTIHHAACIRHPVELFCSSSFADFSNSDLKSDFLFLTGMIEEMKNETLSSFALYIPPSFLMDVLTEGAAGTGEFFQEL